MGYNFYKDQRQTLSQADMFDLNALLHPASAFAHPMDVVNDFDLTLNEKRSILASWASDACAVETAPSLRELPSGRIVSSDDVMDALRMLDRDAAASGTALRNHRKSRRRALLRWDRDDGSECNSVSS
jgi:hypothetical protein